MPVIDLENGPVTIAGALDVERTPTGLIPRRLPAWTRPQLTDPYLRLMVPRPAGVRLVFRTEADSVELDVFVTRFRNAYFPLFPVAFDAVANRRRVITEEVRGGDVCVVRAGQVVETERGKPETIRFEGLGTSWKDVEIWLPQAAIVELRELRADGIVAPGELPGRRWVHYGSSISHCAEAGSPTGAWPAWVARRAGLDLTSLAFAGNCHLDPFAARTIRDLPADAITLKIGINVQNLDSLKERTFVPALHGFLDTVRDGHPRTPLLVVSPISCPTAEDRAGPTVQDETGRYHATGDPSSGLTLTRIRTLIEEIAETRAEHDPHLRHLDGRALFGPDDTGDLYDGLHPNAAGYRRIGERFHAHVFGPSGLWPGLSGAPGLGGASQETGPR
ncbi:lipase [Actinomadura sp. KC216]|uniref:GDSL-type esterase/lipase family protein n=1 Tax=Actinomadura sp. KC216 TaxID=2530370 RepID=UPI001049F87F|nr:GDSL-type esterase/lipase family protein [Actinomadura sp. KC216]TDB89637.1 lipase [Actinomadura sp. KC216]